MRRIRAHLTFANVASGLALFVALATGGAYAANTVFSGDIADGQVKTVDLANAAVTVDKIANGAVTSDKVKDASLAGRDVVDDSLKGADIDESTLSGVGGGGVGNAEAWHVVAAGSGSSDRCDDPSVTAVFCSDEPSEGFFFPARNYGGDFSPVAFYKDQLGVVHLKGLAQIHFPGSSSDVREFPLFRLPSAYRPATRRVFASVGSSSDGLAEVAQGRIDIEPHGLVILVEACGNDNDSGGFVNCSASGGDITLDGITFRPQG